MIAVGVRQRVVAFETPLRERRATRSLRRAVNRRLKAPVTSADAVKCRSVAISDAEVFQFVSFLLSARGSATHPQEAAQLMQALDSTNPKTKISDFDQWDDENNRYMVAHRAGTTVQTFVLVTYRPKLILPLCMASARRAVSFVHAVVALVTANAYISTLGGGHFLCRHLDRSTLLAKMQIGISMGLHDPILESKCRVNLAYNALQLGRFGRARRILREEEKVAEKLDSRELRNVCVAATVYLNKLYNLHKEQMLFQKTGGGSSDGRHAPHLHDNFYRQRIIRLTK